MGKNIYLETSHGDRYAIRIETNLFGKITSWLVDDLRSKKRKFYVGHPEIKSISDFKGKRLELNVHRLGFSYELLNPSLDSVGENGLIKYILN